MRKLKVLHVYRTYYPDPPGGLQEAIKQIAISTSQFNVECRIFTLTPNLNKKYIKRPEGVVLRSRSLAAPASCDIGGLDSFKLFATATKWADIIHYHFPWPFADILHKIIRPSAPSVLTYHSDIVRQKFAGLLYSPLMRSMLSDMSVIVATSPDYAKTSRVLTEPIFSKKIQVIPLGINERSCSEFGTQILHLKFPFIKTRSYFLFVGVLRYYKGLYELIESAILVRSLIVIAGSGPEESSLHELCLKLNITNVLFTGQVSDEERDFLIANCRALILPSNMRSEAFGMVLIEASMYGRPMITCDIGSGTSYVNLHEVTGYVVTPNSSTELANAMNKLECDDVCTKFGLEARSRYECLFSGDALGRAYADLYREVINSSGSALN